MVSLRRLVALGAGLALIGVAAYWLSSSSPALIASPDKVAVVRGAAGHVPDVASVRPGPSGTPRFVPATEPEAGETSQSRISRQILPLLNRTGPNGRVFHDRLVTERRDDPWASKAEDDLRTAYYRLKGVGDAGRSFDIQCGATVCEVSGDLEDRPGSKGSDAMASVQAFELIRAMAALGYLRELTIFGEGADGRTMFVSYFNRGAPEDWKAPPMLP